GGAGEAVQDRPDWAALDEDLEERAAHLEEAEHVLGSLKGEADAGVVLIGAAKLGDDLAGGEDSMLDSSRLALAQDRRDQLEKVGLGHVQPALAVEHAPVEQGGHGGAGRAGADPQADAHGALV